MTVLTAENAWIKLLCHPAVNVQHGEDLEPLALCDTSLRLDLAHVSTTQAAMPQSVFPSKLGMRLRRAVDVVDRIPRTCTRFKTSSPTGLLVQRSRSHETHVLSPHATHLLTAVPDVFTC